MKKITLLTNVVLVAFSDDHGDEMQKSICPNTIFLPRSLGELLEKDAGKHIIFFLNDVSAAQQFAALRQGDNFLTFLSDAHASREHIFIVASKHMASVMEKEFCSAGYRVYQYQTKRHLDFMVPWKFNFERRPGWPILEKTELFAVN